MFNDLINNNNIKELHIFNPPLDFAIVHCISPDAKNDR